MLVTIGMPVYNRPKELVIALNSVLSQTYSNIEIVISNNSSTDKKVDDVIKGYLKYDTRIKYYFQESPLPVIDNFKFVLEKASGAYFMWLSDDDWVDANFIGECLLFLNENGDYSIACGECVYHTMAGDPIQKFKMPSIDSGNAFKRVIEYYRNVKLNGYFYGIRKTSLSREILLQNKLAFDWIYLAAFIFRGKVKVLNNTVLHITTGGMSNNAVELNRNIGANNFITRNFIGLTASFNSAYDIFNANVYPIHFFSKLFLSFRVFFTVFYKTFMWDVIGLKRLVFGKRGK
jgi:glycosyltransferase involved in cell wall biosynthesis